jgi:hypothetical protein
MAQPSQCPYCHTGIPMWIFVEMTNTYILKCSHCEASGNYHTAQQMRAGGHGLSPLAHKEVQENCRSCAGYGFGVNQYN